MRAIICFAMGGMMFLLMIAFALETSDNRWAICLGVGILFFLVGIYYLPTASELRKKGSSVTHSKLENAGPTQYDVTKLVSYLTPAQLKLKAGVVCGGDEILAHLKDKGLLKKCVGLADLVEIQNMGIDFFRQNWKGKAILGWGSVGIKDDKDDRLVVPFLCESGDRLVLLWGLVDSCFSGDHIALRFAS